MLSCISSKGTNRAPRCHGNVTACYISDREAISLFFSHLTDDRFQIEGAPRGGRALLFGAGLPASSCQQIAIYRLLCQPHAGVALDCVLSLVSPHTHTHCPCHRIQGTQCWIGTREDYSRVTKVTACRFRVVSNRALLLPAFPFTPAQGTRMIKSMALLQWPSPLWCANCSSLRLWQ